MILLWAFGALPLKEGAQRVRALGRLLAAELRSVGIDLDFAPVLDTDTNGRPTARPIVKSASPGWAAMAISIPSAGS